MWGGTITRIPFSKTAGLKEDEAVCPFTTGSASAIVKITVSGSYFYNSSANRNVARLSRNYFTDNQLVYKQNNDNISNNENHRLNLRVEYAIDSLNKLIFTPAITLQNNESGSDLSGSNSIFDNIFLSRTSTSSKNKVKAYDFSNNILF